MMVSLSCTVPRGIFQVHKIILLYPISLRGRDSYPFLCVATDIGIVPLDIAFHSLNLRQIIGYHNEFHLVAFTVLNYGACIKLRVRCSGHIDQLWDLITVCHQSHSGVPGENKIVLLGEIRHCGSNLVLDGFLNS